MMPIENWLLSYLLNALWQVPLVFVVAWLAARLLAREHPQVEHRLWVTALLAQLLLPAMRLDLHNLWAALRALLPWAASGLQSGANVGVVVGPGLVASSALGVGSHLRTVVIIAYSAAVLYFAGRLLWGLWRTHAIRRSAEPLALPATAAQIWSECCHAAAIASDAVRIAHSSEVAGPVTIGLGSAMLLVPTGFLDRVSDSDLSTVFAHELAHIARHDFARNLLYGFAALPIAWHPMLWPTRARLAESREMVCDAVAADAVVADAFAGRKQYARSLLRLASLLTLTQLPPNAHAIGILDSHSFERRVMTLTRKPTPATTGRRLITGVACCLLAVGTCGSALALHATVEGSTPAAKQDEAHPNSLNVESGIMAGNKISGANPTYPPEAKEKRIQGRVVLSAVISEDGVVENLKVVESPDALLSKSSLDAVRTWRYRPYLLNGEPVAVDTTINVIYNLGN